MDPNTTLKGLLELSQGVIKAIDAVADDGKLGPEETAIMALDACRMADLMVSLDGWIRKGGFLPDAWKPRNNYSSITPVHYTCCGCENRFSSEAFDVGDGESSSYCAICRTNHVKTPRGAITLHEEQRGHCCSEYPNCDHR